MNLYDGFFGNDSTFGRLMTKLGTIIAVNLLFVISCIPFFTIGAAAAAMYDTVFQMRNEEPINPFVTYWRALRKHFVPACISWLVFAGLLALGTVNLQICAQAGGWMKHLSAGVIAVMLAAVVVMVYLLPVFAVFPGRLGERVKFAVCAAMSHPLKMILVLLLHVVPLMVMYADEVNRPTYAFVGTFFGLGLLAYAVGKIVLPQFERLLGMTENSGKSMAVEK